MGMQFRPSIALLVPGGIGKRDCIPVLVDLIRRLGAVYSITIYSFATVDVHPEFLKSRYAVVFPPARFGKGGIVAAVSLLLRIWKDHRTRHYSLIHGFWVLPQGLAAVLLGILLHIPSIITVPGGDVTYLPRIRYGGLSDPFRRFFTHRCIRRANRIVLLTRFQKTIVEINGMGTTNAEIIPFGIDCSRFPFRQRSFPQPFQIVFIGNLNLVKDPFTALEVFARIGRNHDCRLTVVGQDTLNGAVAAHARRLGIENKITWAGIIPYEKIPGILAAADILLLTSLYEGEAVVVLEAFASGVPVVGTSVGILSDIGNPQMTAPPRDVDGLAAAVEWTIEHEAAVRETCNQNRKFTEENSAERTFQEYGRIYSRLINPSAPQNHCNEPGSAVNVPRKPVPEDISSSE